MGNLDAVLIQLRQERNQLDAVITALEGLTRNGASGKSIGSAKRVLSPAARRRIAAAQKARWAAWHRKQKAA